MWLKNFIWKCFPVLPAVYDDTLSFYEMICKLVKKINEVISGLNEVKEVTDRNADAVLSVNSTKPDENGNVNLSGVSGVTSVSGIGADGSGNVPLTLADLRGIPWDGHYANPNNPVADIDYYLSGYGQFYGVENSQIVVQNLPEYNYDDGSDNWWIVVACGWWCQFAIPMNNVSGSGRRPIYVRYASSVDTETGRPNWGAWGKYASFFKVIWTNPNESASFPATVIQTETNRYDSFNVYYSVETADGKMVKCAKVKANRLFMLDSNSIINNGAIHVASAYRSILIQNNSISIGACYYTNDGIDTKIEDNGYIIPLWIEGE